MKNIVFALILLTALSGFPQNPGDTIIIPTINYSQTFTPNGRDTMIFFPDGDLTYEKIIMSYNMRCKDGNVSTPNNTNLGCGEWDYSCNTNITDSSRVDSVLNYFPSHQITHFDGEIFEYVESPTYNYYQYAQQEVTLIDIISESQVQLGNGSLALENAIKTDEYSGKSFFLFSAEELMDAGLSSGEIDGIIVNSLNNASAGFLRVKIKSTEINTLDQFNPETENFEEVFFTDYEFLAGENRIQFYNPFNWDGNSNLLFQFSFTNENIEDPLHLLGEDIGEDKVLYALIGTHIINDIGYTSLPATSMENISDEMTLSFWSYGGAGFLPAPTTIISGIDETANRSLNIHLPWSNSRIYFDCGYENGGYDRIDKEALPEDFMGQWNHWAFTKNASAGTMNIYLNGELWHSGTGKTKPINISDLQLGKLHNGDRYYFGQIDELRIWNVELDANTIQSWMFANLDDSHPAFDHLMAYYTFNEGQGEITMDQSSFGETGVMNEYVQWNNARGDQLFKGFAKETLRPNITFLQGDYNLSITENIISVQLENIANVVKSYEILPRYGTMLHDSLHLISTDYFWQAGYEYIYNEEGILIDSIEIEPTSSMEITELQYFKRYPSKFELMSFVTPYGIYLDLGMEGKTWYFDVTDYAPILRGWKRLNMDRGGERQEDIDIKFFFIVGTPAREVLDIQQLWRPASGGYQNIMSDRVFEEREVSIHPDGAHYKIKSVVTGHDQEGEFISRQHAINIDGGEEEFTYWVWDECSTIPIYPQGGTWLYDRAGWCPGNPSVVYEFDLTDFVDPGQNHFIDYTVMSGSGTSNYLVNNQLVTYGPANFQTDAAIVDILKPNREIAAYERINPACTNPVILIQNNGSSTLTSLEISFYVEGQEPMIQSWNGSLDFLEKEEVELDIDDYTFWEGSQPVFYVSVNNPNGGEDEYSLNNQMEFEFEPTDLFDTDEWFTIECMTNNQGYQTSYTLSDIDDNIILEMDDLESNTLYSNDVNLEEGCYRLRINDTGDNGLYYWHQPQYGTGYFRLKGSDGFTLEIFEAEFGRYAIYEFSVLNINGLEEEVNENKLVTTYPNPTNDQFNLEFNGFANKDFRAALYNSDMQLIMGNTYTITMNLQKEVIELRSLKKGVYFLHLISDDEKIVKRIIKL